MHISKNGLDLIKKYEGLYLKAYKCPAGVWTIGYGTTNADKTITGLTINKNTVITKEKAEEYLKKSIEKKYEPNINKYLKKYSFNQNQYDALCSFCYNIGSIDQLVNKGNKSIKNISNDIVLYNKAAGQVLKGLVNRRKEEQKLFNTPVKKEIKKEIKKESNKKLYQVTSCGLNVREAAGTKNKIINGLEKGDKVEIKKILSNWGEIKRIITKKGVEKSGKGWICLNYTKKL